MQKKKEMDKIESILQRSKLTPKDCRVLAKKIDKAATKRMLHDSGIGYKHSV